MSNLSLMCNKIYMYLFKIIKISYKHIFHFTCDISNVLISIRYTVAALEGGGGEGVTWMISL